jgi:hypothetical protein
MPILDLQRRLAEVGRIRLGHVVESRSGKKYPEALEAFRLTSRDRDRIAEAAKLYGGTMTKWDQSGIPQWEVYTEADRFPVFVPPSAMAFSQNYELWAGGGCKRRCDGTTEFIGEQPCLCDPANRQCEPHTRLSVIMKDLKGLGVWRLDTTGWYAALEIKGQVETLEFFAGMGKPLPAILRLDRRQIKREGEPVKKFVVPVLDVDITPGELLMGTVAVEPPKAAITAVPDTAGRSASIAEQVAASEQLPSRRRATPIKATGITPRTAAQRGPMPDAQYNGGSSGEPLPQTEEQGYDAIEAAREATEMTQDPPRMVTHGQLTALGTILGKRGYNDRSPEGVRLRLDYCMGLVRQLMPDNPYKDRTINSSKEFTFDEASTLINHFKREDEKANQPAQQPDPQPEPACEENPAQPVDEESGNANDLTAGLDPEAETDEEYWERMEQEQANREASRLNATDTGEGPDPNQMSLL